MPFTVFAAMTWCGLISEGRHHKALPIFCIGIFERFNVGCLLPSLVSEPSSNHRLWDWFWALDWHFQRWKGRKDPVERSDWSYYQASLKFTIALFYTSMKSIFRWFQWVGKHEILIVKGNERRFIGTGIFYALASCPTVQRAHIFVVKLKLEKSSLMPAIFFHFFPLSFKGLFLSWMVCRNVLGCLVGNHFSSLPYAHKVCWIVTHLCQKHSESTVSPFSRHALLRLE